MIEVRPLELDGVFEITPKRHGDERGFFSETYKRSEWTAAGLPQDFVQDNHSFSVERLTLRGLHFQSPPHAQAKLVRAVTGRAWDVVVDLRRGSPGFGAWTALELSAERGNQMFAPVGFAHGLLTLEPDTAVLYKVTAEYAPEHDHGIRWDDPDIAIAWPLDGAAPTLSERDARLPRLKEFATPFSLEA